MYKSHSLQQYYSTSGWYLCSSTRHGCRQENLHEGNRKKLGWECNHSVRSSYLKQHLLVAYLHSTLINPRIKVFLSPSFQHYFFYSSPHLKNKEIIVFFLHTEQRLKAHQCTELTLHLTPQWKSSAKLGINLTKWPFLNNKAAYLSDCHLLPLYPRRPHSSASIISTHTTKRGCSS